HFNIESADIDNDGDLDIMAVYGRITDGPLYIFRNQGARIFNLDSLFLPAGSDRRHGLSVGDIDNDGDIDIVSTGFWTPSATIANVLLNDGTGNFPTDISIYPGPCHGGSNIYDFNDDGWLDILFFRGSPEGYLKIYENIGAPPYFTDASSYSVGPFPVEASGGMVIDVNNDGYVDIYADNTGDNSYLFWGPDYLSYVSLPVNQDHHGMFRDPGNILNKTKTAFYESSIFDTEFESGICSGTVNWIAYDDRDYHNHPYPSLPDPIGAECKILARSGDNPTVDASWTDWDTLTDGGILPSSILGHRYIQYRAELWYENPAYLPWLERMEFEFEECTDTCTPSIDSVWFWEETDCDNRNIVEICYILSSDCPGSTYTISVQMSADSGETWTVPLDSIWDAEGDIGDGILPDTHCFFWEMGYDLPDTEGYDWMVKVTLGSTLVLIDSFSFLDTLRYIISGNDGYVDLDSGYVVLTQNLNDRNGRLILVDSIFLDTLQIEYRFRMTPGDCYGETDTTGGDGISLIFSQYVDPPLATGGLIGIMHTGGWGIAVDNFRNICSDIDGNHIELSIDSATCYEGPHPIPHPLEQISIPFEIIDGLWHQMSVNINYPTYTIIMDDIEYISGDFPSLVPFWAHLGFSASTGGCRCEQVVDDFTIYAINSDYTENADTALAPLDSRPPNVSLSCPDDIVSPGDTIHLHWTIDDLFWSNDECTLYIDYCGLADTILTSDTLDDWIVPDISCDSICFRVAVHDSFCNWGYDECCVPCSTGLFANLINPPNDSIIACDDQQIIFGIHTVDIAETSRILWIADTTDDPDPHSPFGYDYDDLGIVLVDSLGSLGFVVDTMSPTRNFEDTLSYYNLLVLAYNIPNPLSFEQIDSIDSFVSRGGGLLSLPQARLSDEHEVPIHNAVLSPVGISYMTPRINYIDSIPIYSSHPIFDGVESITFYKPFPISCAPSQCLINYSGYCIMAADTYNSGKIVAKANDHFLNNGDLIYTGVSGPVRTDYRGADNYIFARNLFMWLAGRTAISICPLDTSSIILTIDGIDYTIDSSEIYYTEPYLTFTPPSTDYWTSGTHTFSLHIEDTCGNTFDSSYSAIFDFDPPDIDIVNHILIDELDSIEIILTDTIAGLNPDTGYYVIDSTDTIYYSLSDMAGTLYICPDTGWSAGEHRICITACDDPDLCEPNCDDTCFTIIFSTLLSAEIITPPEDAIIACDDQPIEFNVFYDSLCLPLDTNNTMLIIDSADTYTLDSTQLHFDPAESLLQFQPDPGFWNSGWHWFQLHLQDNCGNVFDSLYSAIFDIDPPFASMITLPIGEPNSYDSIPPGGFTYDTQQDIVIDFWDEICDVNLDSLYISVGGDVIPFTQSTYRDPH
ncbi:hypothetical protein DRQ33_05550, partial [bacterium]